MLSLFHEYSQYLLTQYYIINQEISNQGNFWSTLLYRCKGDEYLTNILKSEGRNKYKTKLFHHVEI